MRQQGPVTTRTLIGTVALSVQMIARREIFLCDTWSGPKSTRFATNAPLWIRSAALLAELGRGSCGADVAGWLNATVPSNKAVADSLVIDLKTVESHIARIMNKLDLHQTPDEHRRVLAVLAWLRS